MKNYYVGMDVHRNSSRPQESQIEQSVGIPCDDQQAQAEECLRKERARK